MFTLRSFLLNHDTTEVVAAPRDFGPPGGDGPLRCWSDLEVSWVMGVPMGTPNSWMVSIRENPTNMDDFGDAPILGNLHLNGA